MRFSLTESNTPISRECRLPRKIPAIQSRECRLRREIDTGEGWLAGLEPATPRSTIWCSAMLSYSHHGRAWTAAFEGTTILPGPIVGEWIEDALCGRVRADDQI